MNDRILFVDDELKVLKGYERNLGVDFNIAIESDPVNAVRRIETDGPFAVIVSDFQMPIINGVELLSKAREKASDTVRIMLTGYADLEKAISAVNEGSVFRFITTLLVGESG